MSPREVQGLQALAVKNGGSLTINPETGLPEAGFLDKLLPAIIGFALAPMTAGTSLAFLGATPLASALTVGGLQTLRTGDLGKGISAGLGAYGGAGLSASLATAGGEALASQAAGAGAGITSDMAYNLADAGITDAGIQSLGNVEAANQALQQTAGERLAAASPFDKISAGASKVASDPSSLLTKDNFKYLASAAAPILADQAVKSNMPTTTTRPGAVRTFSYNPYDQFYTPTGNYEVPVKAAGGGLMGMDDGGYNPGQLDFTQRSEPVARMATGGVVALAAGGDYRSLTKDSSVDDIASAYKQFTTAGGGNTAANQKAAIDYLTNLGIGQDKIGQAYGSFQASPTYANYSNEQIGKYLTDNPTANIAAAAKATNANPAAVNQYIANLTSGYTDPTATKGGSGTLGIYNQMKAHGIDPDELYSASVANNPQYAGFSKNDITKAYNLDKNAYALSDQLKGNVSDKDWVKLMDDNKYSVLDAARAFGLSTGEVQSRYNAVKNAEKTVTCGPGFKLNAAGTACEPIVCGTGFKLNAAGTACEPITKVDDKVVSTGGDKVVDKTCKTGYHWDEATQSCVKNVDATQNTTTTVTTPTNIATADKTALPVGVSGAGITTINPNGTVTTRPNIPGIPEDGFTGMSSLRKAYTDGGGSLGYIPYAPKTMEEFEGKYNTLTGGSKQSYDYLTGKTPYSATPATATGEIMKPYSESVLGVPRSLSSKKVLFDPATKTYKNNPDYIPVSYTDKGEKVYGLSSRDITAQLPDIPKSDYEKWMSENNVTLAQIAQALNISLAEAKKRYGGTKTAAATTDNSSSYDGGGGGGGGEANGGLMKLARGGMAQQFDLGGYSDGGRLLRGPGDGVSDSIPATIGNKRPARLADGEFVVPARIVSELGNGSTEAGARKLYAMMDRVQRARRGTVGKGKVAKNSRSDKYLPA
jgi:hypothetical protein